MKNRVVLLIFVVLLFSCERTQQEIIADTYAEWMGKQIKIPHNPIFTVDARDTVSVVCFAHVSKDRLSDGKCCANDDICECYQTSRYRDDIETT